MEIRQILAENIVRLRREKGLSQEALGWESGVARRYMAKVERGETSTGVDVIGRIAKALEVEPVELFRPLPKRSKRASG